jgi:hypothetical protein
MTSALAHSRLGKIVVLLVICLLLAGCRKSKLTQENFDKIKNDMTLKDVEAILGEGTSQGGDGANVAAQVGVDVSGGVAAQAPSTVDYVWEGDKKKITVTFKQGKVIAKKGSGL